jgi:hypothetical protein
MATILGSCGCGCAGGCGKVKKNCNFVLRKYVYEPNPTIVWTSEATDEDKACVEQNNCAGYATYFSVCTGESEIYKDSGGGGGEGCYIDTDDGPRPYTIPCAQGATELTSETFYIFYDTITNTGELFNGEIRYNGVTYNIVAGSIVVPEEEEEEEPTNNTENSPEPIGSEDTSTPISLGTLIGTFKSSYTDESIDFDQIGELELTEEEKAQKFCKFSYNFRFTPDDDSTFFVLALPCDEAVGYGSVSLDPTGRAYFQSSYDEEKRECFITGATNIILPNS